MTLQYWDNLYFLRQQLAYMESYSILNKDSKIYEQFIKEYRTRINELMAEKSNWKKNGF